MASRPRKDRLEQELDALRPALAAPDAAESREGLDIVNLSVFNEESVHPQCHTDLIVTILERIVKVPAI